MTDDYTWAIGFYNAGMDDDEPEEPEPEDDRPVCDQCGEHKDYVLEKGRRLICQQCDEDNRMEAAGDGEN